MSECELACKCPICERCSKIRALIKHMEEKGMSAEEIQVVEDMKEDLEVAEFDLDWIVSGMDKNWFSVKEVMKRFGIYESEIKAFLDQRRQFNNEKKPEI